MANSWTCNLCSAPVSALGAFVKLSQNRYRHVNCHDTLVSDYAVVEHEQKKGQEEADKLRVQKDREEEMKDAKIRDLIFVRSRGKERWTREDRAQLVEAHMICVHCGCDLSGAVKAFEGWSGRPPAGIERKHCGPCYMARDFGEKTAAQGAAKSADGIASVAAALAKVPAASPPGAVNKPEEKSSQDRFNLIEME